jgi:hypothetical protein
MNKVKLKKGLNNVQTFIYLLVGDDGLEPPTSCL